MKGRRASRLLAALFVWIVTLATIPARAAPPTTPAPASGPTAAGGAEQARLKDCLSGLVFVGEVEAVSAEDRIAGMVAAHIADGLRFGLPDAKQRVVSFYELRAHAKNMIPSMQSLHRFLSVEVENQFRSILGKQGSKMTAYIQATLLRTGDQTSVGISLFCLDKVGGDRQAELAARKFIRGYGATDAGLLDRVFAAAEKMTKRTESLPEPRVAGGLEQTVPKDSVVVLDAGGSEDPDDDAIVVSWSCRKEVGCEQRASKLFFTASSMDTVEVDLTVSKLIEPKKSQSRRVKVHVVGSPKVTVDDSRILKMEGQTKIALKGTCASCKEWKWIEVSGPVVTVPDGCHGKGETVDCTVLAGAPGEYSFALIGHNELGSDRKDHTIGVAPLPVVIPDVPAEVVVDHTARLDGAASHDVFGGNLRYYWEISKDEFPGATNCAPLDGSVPEGVKLRAPTQAVAEFSASQLETYHVRLTVLSERRFGGHESIDQQCKKAEIKVRNPTWLPFLVGGADFLPFDSFETNGFRLKLGGTIRASFLPSWAGVHVSQTLLRTDPNGSDAKFGGGTSAGFAWAPYNVVQIHLGVYGRSWGGTAIGPELGGELRVQRYLVLSGVARYEFNSGDTKLVLGSFIGGGLDF